MSEYRERACTCHPDEAPRPCPQKYAYSECVLAALRAENERLQDELRCVHAHMNHLRGLVKGIASFCGK